MSIFKKLTGAEEVKLKYQLMRLASPKINHDAPELHPDNPTLPNDEDPDDPINQLPAGLQGLPLKVNIKNFPGAQFPIGIPGIIRLTWDGTEVGDPWRYTTPVDAVDEFPHEMTLPGGLTNAPGRHLLSYTQRHGGNRPIVRELEINIDTQAPIPNGMPIVPPEVQMNGITKAYLDIHGKVLVTIPDYGTKKRLDRIDLYWGTTLPTALHVGFVIRQDITTPITFDLTADKVGTEEGEKALFYTMQDRKGNLSQTSPFNRLNVTLTDPPVGLLPPDIPQAADGIDREDAIRGVGVGIVDEYINYLPGDKLLVTWDGQILLPAVTIPGFPFHHTVPFVVVHNGDDGAKVVTVSYQIMRGTALYPPVPPSRSDVAVDLRKPGPDNPDIPPGTVNPALALVTVQGAVTTDPNKLTVDDIDEPATAAVRIYDNYKAGDVVQLYWKGVPVPEATLPATGGVYRVLGTEPADFMIPFTIPWAIIDAGGNGDKLPVHYDIAHNLNGNKDTSRPQEVNVLIRDGVVPMVEFQHLDPDFTDWLNCQSLREDTVKGTVVEVLVQGGEPQLANQEIIFTYQGYRDSSGTIEKPGTKFEVPYTPTTQEAVDGFIVKIPYEPFRVTESDWGTISYVATVDGFPVPSARHLVRVFMDLGGGATCKIPVSRTR